MLICACLQLGRGRLQAGVIQHCIPLVTSVSFMQRRGAPFVFVPQLDLVFYCMGSGEYDESALAEVITTVMASLKDILGRPPTESSMFEKYTRLVVVLDEVIDEGMVQSLDVETIRKGAKHKGWWE